jgi:hypothetical protein
VRGMEHAVGSEILCGLRMKAKEEDERKPKTSSLAGGLCRGTETKKMCFMCAMRQRRKVNRPERRKGGKGEEETLIFFSSLASAKRARQASSAATMV